MMMADAKMFEPTYQLCEQSTMSESIVTFVEQNKGNKKMTILYAAWEKLCDDLHILIYCRWKMDAWFQKCYHSGKDMRRLTNEVSFEMAQKRKEELFEDFKQLIAKIIQSEDFIHKMTLQAAGEEIIKKYGHRQEVWIDNAIECVEKENDLMAEFKQVKIEKEKVEAVEKIERDIKFAKQLQKEILTCVEKMHNEVSNWNQHYKKQEENEATLHQLRELLDQIAVKNGVISEQKQLEDKILLFEQQTKKALEQLSLHNQEIVQKFRTVQICLTELLQKLEQDVMYWQEQFKLQYVELATSPDLEQVAQWCGQAGRLIYDLEHVSIVRWRNVLTNVDWDQTELDELSAYLSQLLAGFLQRTFVVTEQEDCIIKVDKKHLPKFAVRILAAEDFPERIETITARFAFEDDINTCCQGNDLDLLCMTERIEERKIHLLSNSYKFDGVKRRHKYEASFESLHFKGKFSRQSNQAGRQVHEEKSRVVFTTKVDGFECWTLSLPLVVTTGANQGCLGQASVLWQCYSTDVYSVPIDTRNELPWCEVANMLQAKIQNLCPERKLTTENIVHLKRRLFGRKGVSDQELVSLKKFCFDKMEKSDGRDDQSTLNFSFWKWFIGIYNLLDKYLLKFWKDGLILGFLSKEDAKEKLKGCKNDGRSGIFILRFSDQNITDSQGWKSVFGHLTACVFIIREEADGRKKKLIYDMDVAGHKKLKDKNLANILKETHDPTVRNIYQYLYPGDSREEMFDKHCHEDTVVQGYTGTRDAFVVHLEQQCAALEISCGKHARTDSVDSGIEAASPADSLDSVIATACTAAKVKRTPLSTKHPNIVNRLKHGNHIQSNVSSPQSSPYPVLSPTYSVQSPNYAEQSHAATSFNNVYSQPESPINCSENSPQQFLDSHFSMSLIGSEQHNIPPNLLPCESILMTTGAMNHGDELHYVNLYEDAAGPDLCTSYETESSEVIVQPGNGYSSLESDCTCESLASSDQTIDTSPVQNDDVTNMIQMENYTLRQREPVTSTVPEQPIDMIGQQSNPDLAQIFTLLHDRIPAEDLKCILAHLEQGVNHGTAQTVSKLDSTSVVMTSDSTPGLTSSGSMSDAFNFSQQELAEGQQMNSGTIDMSVFATVDTGSGGMSSESIDTQRLPIVHRDP